MISGKWIAPIHRETNLVFSPPDILVHATYSFLPVPSDSRTAAEEHTQGSTFEGHV